MRKPLDTIEQAWLFEPQKPFAEGPGANFYYQAVASGHSKELKGSILTNDKEKFAARHGVDVASGTKVEVKEGSFLIALEAASDLAMNGYKHPDDAPHSGEYRTVFVATLSDWKEGNEAAPRYGAMQRVAFLSKDDAVEFTVRQAELVESLSREEAVQRVTNAMRGVWSIIQVNDAKLYPLTDVTKRHIRWDYRNVSVFNSASQAATQQPRGLSSKEFIQSADYWISCLLELEEWAVEKLIDDKNAGLIFKEVPDSQGSEGYYEAVIGEPSEIKLIKK